MKNFVQEIEKCKEEILSERKLKLETEEKYAEEIERLKDIIRKERKEKAELDEKI